MGIDYYSVLEILRSATFTDIRKAYARVAVREHPDRTRDCDGSELSDELLDKRCEWFRLANEAYEVLSCPLLRACYDQFGEEGLKNGVPLRDPELFLKPWQYHDDCFKTYRSFFGTESASAPLLFAWQLERQNNGFLRRPDGTKGPWFREPPLSVPLQLRLELVTRGGTAEVRFSRREIRDGFLETREHVLQIQFPPGVQPGTRFLFPREGHQAVNSIPGDVEVVTADLPHRELQREGSSDLIVRYRVSLAEALLGCTVQVTTLDGRTLRFRITDLITPNYELRLIGEGLPRCETSPREPADINKTCYCEGLETSASSPETSASSPETSASSPKISASLPKTSASSPKTSASSPATSASPPATSASSPKTSASSPETSAFSPEASASSREINAYSSVTNASLRETSASSPKISASLPKTSASSPKTSASSPETGASPPATSASPPEASVSSPETSASSRETNSSPSYSSSNQPCVSCSTINVDQAVNMIQPETETADQVETHEDRGDLVLRFNVEWPQHLPVSRRNELRTALRGLAFGIPDDRDIVMPCNSQSKSLGSQSIQ